MMEWWNGENVIGKLLDHGATVDLPDDLGFTPLAVACGGGHLQVIRRLLDAGANPNVTIKALEGGTVMHLAASWGRLDVASVLIENSAVNLKIVDDQGRAPIDFALDAGAEKLCEVLRRVSNGHV